MAENVIDMEEEKKQLEEERIQAYVNKPIDVKFEEAGAQPIEVDEEKKQLAMERGFKEKDNSLVQMYNIDGYDVETKEDIEKQGNEYGLLSGVERNPDGTYRYDDIHDVSEEHVSHSGNSSREHTRSEKSHDDDREIGE